MTLFCFAHRKILILERRRGSDWLSLCLPIIQSTGQRKAEHLALKKVRKVAKNGKRPFLRGPLGCFFQTKKHQKLGRKNKLHNIHILSDIISSMNPVGIQLIFHHTHFSWHDRSKVFFECARGLSAKTTFQLRYGTRRSCSLKIGEQSVSVSGKSKCKGPEAKKSQMSLRNCKAGVIVAKRKSWQAVDVVREIVGAWLCRTLQDTARDYLK